MAWTSLCEITELTEGRGRYVEIEGFQLAVFLDAGKISVLDNTCPHAGGSLASGIVQSGCAVCPWHNWKFQLDSGQLASNPAVKVHRYPVRILSREHYPDLVQADLPMP